MLKIKGIDHIVLRTQNLDKLLWFYGDVLGCPLERTLSPEVGLNQLRAGNALIDIVTVDSELGKQGGGPPGLTNHNVDHLCLQVDADSVNEILTHLDKYDIEIGAIDVRYGATGFGQSVYVNDPDGNMVELKPV